MGKIFLAAPFTFNFEADLLDDIENFLGQLGYSVVVPHDFANINSTGEELQKEIKENMEMVEASDIIIAEVTNPSHGVGMEIFYAHKLGKKVFLIAKSGTKVSGMAHAHSHGVVEYNDLEDLKQKLESCLNSV